jgi:hypothetical protein
MAKSRIGGIDSLIKSTKDDVHHKEETIEKSTRVFFEVPVSLKKEMTVHCAMNDVSMKDFITKAIRDKLKQ